MTIEYNVMIEAHHAVVERCTNAGRVAGSLADSHVHRRSVQRRGAEHIESARDSSPYRSLLYLQHTVTISAHSIATLIASMGDSLVSRGQVNLTSGIQVYISTIYFIYFATILRVLSLFENRLSERH